MKTINDLVDKLNNYVAYGEYYIAKGTGENYLLRSSYEDGQYVTIFEFEKNNHIGVFIQVLELRTIKFKKKLWTLFTVPIKTTGSMNPRKNTTLLLVNM